MKEPEEVHRLREQLLAVLAEDSSNASRLLARLDALSRETGIGAHAALLLLLTHLSFEEEEARRHWEAILTHRHEMSVALGRDVGIRVAALDYFLNLNRQLACPVLAEIELEAGPADRTGADGVTGLARARTFCSAVQVETRRARRYGHPLSVAVFDLDDFRARCGTASAAIGDRLLREAAILLRNKIRDIDLAARLEEDQFAVLLPQTDRNGALLVAERFRREVESHFRRREVEGRPSDLTVSGGVASCPEDAKTAEELIARAEQALYEAKAAGKNAVRAYSPDRRRYVRFDLEPGRFEVEVVRPRDLGPGRGSNLSRGGILFTTPEPLEVGETIEIRLADSLEAETSGAPVRLRGRVVRLEELPESDREGSDRFEVGVAFEPGETEAEARLFEFLERARAAREAAGA